VQYLGFLLVGLALVGFLVGLVQRSKGKKILAAPFKRTGEIAQNPGVADAKGIVSCEGAVNVQAPAYAPCSGTPCLYYEVEVVQEWSKSVVTEDGAKTEKGKNTVQTVSNGTVFYVDDGSGPIAVDPRHGMDVELDKSFEQAQNVAYGDVVFGQFQTHVPALSGDKRGLSVKVIEKIVPPQGGMFVMGQLANQMITKPNGMLGKLRASRKGRTALLGATKRNATIGLVAGAVMFVPGMGLSIFASPPAPSTSAQACNIVDESKPNDPCRGKIYNDDGSDVPLTVSKAGTFAITAGPPKGKKIPVIAAVSIKDAAGKLVVEDEHEHAEVALQPGTYTINVKDSIAGDAAHFKGGFSYELLVKRTSVVEAPVASAATTASGSASATLTGANVDKPVAKASPPAALKASAAAKASASAPVPSSSATTKASSAAPAPAPSASAAKKK